MVARWYKKIFSVDYQNNFWTLLASGAVSAYSFLVILIVMRWVGLAEAGMVSFAVAVALFSTNIITFSVRIYQGSDTSQEYSLQSYLGLRICTAFLATIVVAVFLIVSRFDITRTIIVMLFYFIFLTFGFADVFMGDLQQKGKMRIAGRMQVCSFGLGFVAVSITLFTTQSLIVSLISSSIVIFLTFIAWIWFYQNHFGRIRVKYDVAVIKVLVRTVSPLFLSGLIFGFLYNMQKYYLGFLYTDESVAILTVLLMPVTALHQLSGSFFSGAEMTKTAEIFTSGQVKKLSRRINRQLLWASAISMFFMMCVFSFGEPLLSWLFAINLSPYRAEFIIVALGGAFLSIFSVLYSGMAVMRMQKAYLYAIFSVALVVAPLLWFIVARYGITGAAFTNLAFLTPLSVVLFMVCRNKLAKLKPSQ